MEKVGRKRKSNFTKECIGSKEKKIERSIKNVLPMKNKKGKILYVIIVRIPPLTGI